jgi:hypothetical protein
MPAIRPTSPREPADDSPAELEHPRGTLAIVIAFGVLFAAGWFAMYLFMFLKRGALHP